MSRRSYDPADSCAESWDAMARRPDGARHCDACDAQVVDFTKLSRAQAESRLRALGGETCGRIRIDTRTGAPWFPPEPARARGWAGGLVLAAALSAGCGAETGSREGTSVASVDPGPPLEPVDPGAVPPAPATPPTQPVPVAELALPEDSPTPTAAQRRLTARKRGVLTGHAPPVPVSHPTTPPHVQEWMGDVVAF